MWDYASLAAFGSNAIGAVGAYWGQQSANATNAKIAAQQMQFQREANQGAMNFSRTMSNTQWQRGVADMRAAGINPMLAVSQGGASAPSGVTSGGSSYTAQNPLSHLPQSVASAIQALQLQTQIDNIKADTQLKTANAANTMAQLPVTTAKAATETSILNDINDFYVGTKNAIKGNPSKGGFYDRWSKTIGNALADTQQYLTTTLPQQMGSTAKAIGESIYSQRKVKR